MKLFNLIYTVLLVLMISCNDAKMKEYASMHFQSGSFGTSELDSLLKGKQLISEDSLKKIADFSDKSYKEKILLAKNNEEVIVSIYEETNNQTIIYSVGATDFLIVYSTHDLHSEQLFVLNDEKFKSIIQELIENKAFILNTINEGYPPSLESTVEFE